MEEIIRGKAYVLGDNVDTDQIIPAQYLTFNPAIPEERKQVGRYALCGVPEAQAGLPKGQVAFVDQSDPARTTSEFTIIIGGKNFGCGSSREHAPLALAEAGIKAVVAEFYARIFFRNAVNGGYLVPFEIGERLTDQIRTGDRVEIRTGEHLLIDLDSGHRWQLKPLGEVGPIVEAGGLFGYARQVGMM